MSGHGRTPKVYFRTGKGWELLVRESDIPSELLGGHKEVKVDSRWSQMRWSQMYHRLRTVDLIGFGGGGGQEAGAPVHGSHLS
jgi:hypothetical protein